MTEKTDEGAAAALAADSLTIGAMTVDEFITLARGSEGPSPARDLVARLDAADSALETANEEIADLREKLAKAKAPPKTAKPAAKSEKRRDFGKVAELPVTDEIGPAEARAALAETLAQAGSVELVLTAKGKEAAGIPPYLLSGNPWRSGMAGLVLSVPVDLHGPTPGNAISFDGYALIVDGKAVAHRKWGDARVLQPGQHVRIVDDIVF